MHLFITTLLITKQKKLLEWSGWQDLASTFAEANANTIALTITPNDDLITVLQEFTGGTIIQIDGLGSAPTQLQHGAKGVFRLTTDGTRGH